MNKIVYYFRVSLWLMLAIFVGFLSWKIVVPGGKIAYVMAAGASDDFIEQFEPLDRLTVSDGRIKINGNPIYFSLRTPRPFDKLRLTVKYKPAGQPLIAIGLLKNRAAWSYEVKPLYNELINRLYHSADWGIIENDHTLLLQRREKYDSLRQFLAKPPAPTSTAVYDYDAWQRPAQKIDGNFSLAESINYLITNYQPPKLLPDGYYESQVEFDLRGAERDSHGYKLMVSLPGWNEADAAVEIVAIKAELSGKTWREFFKL